jgi:hypothetical protein
MGMWMRSSMVVGSVLALAACGKKEADPTPTAAASALAPSTAASSAMAFKYAVDPKGKTSIDMPAPKEHIKAGTTASGGSLEVDLKNVANTRGEVKVDLTTLKTSTFGDEKKDSSQSEHAQNWLEVGSLVTADMKEKNRWVVFAIRSIEAPSAADVTKIAAVKEGDLDVRTVTLTAKGEFLLHGHKTDKTVPLEAKFQWAAGAAPDAKPTAIVVKTKEPLHITLAEHDVKPRDNFGKLAEGALGLLGTKVANVADVSFEIRATPL